MNYKNECEHCLKHNGKCEGYDGYPCNQLPNIKISYLQLNSTKVFLVRGKLIEATIIDVSYIKDDPTSDDVKNIKPIEDILTLDVKEQLDYITVTLIDKDNKTHICAAYDLYKNKDELKMHLECKHEIEIISIRDKHEEQLELAIKLSHNINKHLLEDVFGEEE